MPAAEFPTFKRDKFEELYVQTAKTHATILGGAFEIMAKQGQHNNVLLRRIVRHLELPEEVGDEALSA